MASNGETRKFEPTDPISKSFHDRWDRSRILLSEEDARVTQIPEHLSRQHSYRKWPTGTIGFHVNEIPPNMDCGTHRHMCEAIIYIIEGEGYTLIDGERYDWKAGDALWVPPLTWHSQHSGNCKVRQLGMWNVPLLEALGLSFHEEAGDSGHPDAKPWFGEKAEDFYGRGVTITPTETEA